MSAPPVSPVTPQDIREKLEEIKEAATRTVTKGGTPKVVGTLVGAAVAMAVSFIAGRRSAR